jgi:uncharacterized membrane protein YbhN (UPF0104 family)
MALRIFRFALGAAILVYLYRSGMFKLSPLARLLDSWPISLAGVAILLADIFIMGIRTCWMFEPVGMRLSIWKSFQLNLVASFFTNVIPGAAGGDVARIYYTTKGNPGNRGKVTIVVLLDRGMGLFSMLVLPLLVAPFFADLLRNVRVLRDLVIVDGAAAAAMLAGFVVCVHSEWPRELVNTSSARWEKWLTIPRRVLDVLRDYRGGAKQLAGALTMSVIANASVILVMTLALLPINPTWLSWKMSLLVPLGQLANSFPLENLASGGGIDRAGSVPWRIRTRGVRPAGEHRRRCETAARNGPLVDLRRGKEGFARDHAIRYNNCSGQYDLTASKD